MARRTLLVVLTALLGGLLYASPAFAQCPDCDGDGYEWPADCNDAEPDIYPGAPQICDGLNNDCDHPAWPSVMGTNEEDGDGDGYTGCEGDCDFLDPLSYPAATEICDGRDNDCDGEIDESLTCSPGCAAPDKVVPDVRVTDSLGTRALSLTGLDRTRLRSSFQAPRFGGFGIWFARLDGMGDVVAGPVRVTTNSLAYRPALIWTGIEFALVWDGAWDADRDGRDEIYFTRLDASSGLEIGEEVPISDSGANAAYPDIAWSGSGYGVAWMDDRDGNDEIYFARLDLAGNVLGGEMRLTDAIGSSSFPKIAWTGTRYAITWYDNRDGNNEIYFATVDAGGSPSDGLRVTEDAEESIRPQIAWSGSELGVLWIDDRDGQRELYFVRLDESGGRLSDDLRLTQDPAYIYDPRLIWAGGEYGVAWRDLRDGDGQIYFTRLDASGAKLTPDLRVSANVDASLYPSLAWMGSAYGVAWSDTRYELDEPYYWLDDIYFTRVLCDCTVDNDSDGYTNCSDCDDTRAEVFPRAEELCDGLNNDCTDSIWPAIPTSDIDDDDDGLTECEGDCDDTELNVYPGAAQVCDGFNNDCNDPAWPSLEGTNEVSECLIDVTVGTDGGLSWVSEHPYSPWNVYRGDLSVLKQSSPETPAPGIWTQQPGSNLLAAQACALSGTEYTDTPTLAPGEVAFYLVTGLTGSVESGLGRWRQIRWRGTTGNRFNDNPCP